MGNKSPVAIAALTVSLLAFAVCIVSLVTDHWGTVSITNQGSSHAGLIKACLCNDDGDCICVTYITKGETEAWIKAVFSSVCVALAFNLVAVVTTFLIIFHPRCDSLLGVFRKVAVVVLFLAAIWKEIAVIVFAIKYESLTPSKDVKFGWSWGMAILSGILDIICLAAVLLTKPTGNQLIAVPSSTNG